MSETQTEAPVEAPAGPATEPEPTPEPTLPEPDPESEPEIAPELAQPEPQPAADESDQRIIDSQKKWTNYEKAIRGIWGEYESNLLECPLCFTSHKGLIDLNDSGQYPEEILAAITEYARGSAQANYRAATQVRECPDCAGWGKVKSGSHVAAHETVTCPACKGYGYVPPPVPSSSGNGYAEAAQIEGAGVGATPDEAEPQTDADIWGSPRLLPDGQENPNYGKMPQYKNRSLP